MVTNSDNEWLRRKHPALDVNGGEVSGTIEFTASYDAETHLFRIIDGEAPREDKGVILTGKFSIVIKERTDKTFSSLPALFVNDVEPSEPRHFGQADKSACLCSPFEESEYLTPDLQFVRFMEELVIPFLYGQLWYSSKGYWPWPEYAHGATGLLESYFKAANARQASVCVQMLAKHQRDWPKVKAVLQQKSGIKGHTACFCPRADHFRRCHPNAWRGAQQLQQDIRFQSVPIP